MKTTTLTIGQVARAAGVGRETIRFYERRGLIAEPPRGESGYRRYPPETVPRLLFIRRAKELGFSLAEIRELLSLHHSPVATCSEVRQRAAAKLADIEERIRDLERMRAALSALVTTCSGQGPASQCPILEALTGQPMGAKVKIDDLGERPS